MQILPENDAEVHAVALSADGRLLATGRHHGDFQLWDVARGKRLLTYIEGEHVRAVAMTPDGRFSVCGGSSGILSLIDNQDAKVLRRFTPSMERIRAVAISPDGRKAAAWDWDGIFRVWDVKTGRLAASLSAPFENPLLVLTTSHLAAVGQQLLDLRAIPKELPPRLRSLSLDHSGKLALLSYADGSVVYGHIDGARVELLPAFDDDVPSVSLPDSTRVSLDAVGERAVLQDQGGQFHVVQLLDRSSHPLVPESELMRLVREELPKVARAAARLRGSSIEWEESVGVSPPAKTSYPVSHAVLTPDGRKFVTASRGEALRVWDTYTGTCVAVLPTPFLRSFGEGEVEDIASLPDSTGVVFARFDRALFHWCFKSSEARCLRAASVHTWPAKTAISPRGDHVVWAASTARVELWEINTGRLLKTGSVPKYMNSVRWLHDGRLVFTMEDESDQHWVEVWDARDLERSVRYNLTSGARAVAAASSSGRFCLIAADGQLQRLTFEPGVPDNDDRAQ